MEQVHYELQGQSLIVYVTKELDHHAVIDLRATSDKLIQAGNVILFLIFQMLILWIAQGLD